MRITERQLKRLIKEEVQEEIDFAKLMRTVRAGSQVAGILMNVMNKLDPDDKDQLKDLLKSIFEGKIGELFKQETIALLSRVKDIYSQEMNMSGGGGPPRNAGAAGSGAAPSGGTLEENRNRIRDIKRRYRF